MDYVQCTLQKDSGETMVTWLPLVKNLKKNNYVTLDGEPKGREGAWKLKEVGTTKFSEEYVRERRDDYRHQRKASDI